MNVKELLYNGNNQKDVELAFDLLGLEFKWFVDKVYLIDGLRFQYGPYYRVDKFIIDYKDNYKKLSDYYNIEESTFIEYKLSKKHDN